jgi:hypothetical protein
LNEAIVSYRQGLEIEPSNQELQRLMRECEGKLNASTPDGSYYSSNRNTNESQNSINWQAMASRMSENAIRYAQKGFMEIYQYWCTTSNEIKVAYIVAGAIIACYIWTYFTSYFWGGYYNDNYYYHGYGGYGAGGGLSMSSLAMIMAAG